MDQTVNYYPNKSKLVFIDDFYPLDYGVYYHGQPFTGIREVITDKEYRRDGYVNRRLHGISFHTSKNFFSIIFFLYNQSRYTFHIYKDDSKPFPDKLYIVYDIDTLDLIIDHKILDNKSKRCLYDGYDFKREDLDYDEKVKYSSEILQLYLDNRETFHQRGLFVSSCSSQNNTFGLTRELDEARIGKALYAYLVQESMKETLGHTVDDDFMGKFVLQNEIATKIIEEDQIESSIKYIAGVSVAYNDIEQKMIAAIVVMNLETQEIVDKAFSESEDVTIHVPDLFAYNEVPAVVQAFEKLNIKPQLIFCDGHGIEHPNNVGLATHLGIELDIPTIGCPKKRLVGHYEKTSLGPLRGNVEDLFFDDKLVGKALRTQENSNPIFVSVGHKICLETALDWVLKTTTHTRVPAIVQEAINLTERLMQQRIRYDFLDDEENRFGILV